MDKVLRTAIEIEVNAIWRYNLKVYTDKFTMDMSAVTWDDAQQINIDK